MALLFELQNVGFEYDRIPALRGLSLEVVEGESITLLGANGSGKSTLLRILDALYFPSQGAITFGGTGSASNTCTMLDMIVQGLN